MTLKIYDAPTGGNVLYTEVQSVKFTRGLFNVGIGAVTPLPNSLQFDRPYYLGVTVDNNPEFLPRTQLTASAFAMRAATADVADSISPGAHGLITGINGTSGAINLIGTGATTVTRSGNTITVHSDAPQGVQSLNGATGSVELVGGSGTTVERSGDRLTITATASIQAVAASDASIVVKNNSGPVAQVAVAPAGITTDKLADASVTDAKIAGGINYSKILNGPTALPPSGNAGGDLSGTYPNPIIATGAVTTAKLADGSVTGAKIDINAVQSGNIANGAVTDAKVGNGISYSKLSGAPTSLPPNGAAGGDLSGTYPNPAIAPNAVVTTKIADGAVTTLKIATGAVSTLQIADGSVSTAKLADQNVTTVKLIDGAVTTPKLADASVTALKIAPGAVGTAQVADGAVTTVKVADAAITDAKVANGISYSKLSGAPSSLPPSGPASGDLAGNYPGPVVAAGAITTQKILDGTIVDADVSPTAAVAYSKLALTNSIQNGDITANAITTSKVANGTVTTSKLADSAVSGLKLLTAAVQTAHIADGAVTLPKINPTGASANNVLTYNGTNVVWAAPAAGGAAGGDLTGTYPNPTVANNAITSAKILDGTIVDADVSPTAAVAYSKLALTNSIQNGDITANAITTSKVANGTVTTSKLADSAVSGLKLLTAAVQTAHIADGAVTDAKVANGISYSKLSGAPTSLPPSGAAGGDLTGTYPNPTVANNAITSAKILDGTLVDADVSPTAAIAYPKLALTNSIQNGDIVANAITTSKVANGTVTTSKMADSAISGLKLLTFAVQTNHIADGAVTLPKINPTGAGANNVLTYNGTNVVWAAPSTGGTAGGDLTGTYPNPTVANNAITSAKILDGTLVDADVSPTAAIAYPKLALTNSIQNGDITANAITTSKVANGTVTTSKMADSAISGLKLLTFAVTTRHLADQSVTLPKINPTGANTNDVLSYNGTSVVWSAPASGATGAAGGDLTGTYPNPTIANNTVTSLDIIDGAVNNQDLAANSVTTSKVANGTVTTSKMADSAISGLKLLTFAVTNRHLADGSVTTSKINPTGANTNDVLSYNGSSVVWSAPAGATGAAGGDLTGTYPNPTIANNTVTSLDIIDGAVSNQDISANAITTSKVANGTVTTSKMADSAISGLKLLTFAVTSRHLADGSVTTSKINPTGASTNDVLTYDGTNVVWAAPAAGGGATGAAGGDLTGTYPNPTLAANSVTSADIQDGTITNADIIAAAGIPYTKLTLTNSVQNGDIVANAITTSKVANGTVTTSKMADSAISGLKLLTFAVTNRHLAAGAVTSDKVNGAGAANGQVLMFNSGTNTVGWANPSVGLSFNRVAISNINSPYTVPAGTDIVGVDVTGGPVTVTLPPANSVPSGKILIVKNELGNAATNNITIQRNGTDLINAASTSVTINTGNATTGISFYSDGVARWQQY